MPDAMTANEQDREAAMTLLELNKSPTSATINPVATPPTITVKISLPTSISEEEKVPEAHEHVLNAVPSVPVQPPQKIMSLISLLEIGVQQSMEGRLAGVEEQNVEIRSGPRRRSGIKRRAASVSLETMSKRRASSLDSESAISEPCLGSSRRFQFGAANESVMGDGTKMIGNYTIPQRLKLIEHFLEKRKRRKWTKTIKYNVRKTFADSRLRVKGRFISKEDESQLREMLLVVL